MTTTDLIELLKKNEFGGATGRPREISFEYKNQFLAWPEVVVNSTGDGLITEITLGLINGDLYIDDPETEESEEKPTTNGDKIRSMTDFELAGFLCFLNKCPEWQHKPSCIKNCVGCWNDWLQSDAVTQEE